MKELIITRGLPGSGKTTFAKKWVEEDPKHRVRVNRDDIRRMLGPYWLPSREDLVTEIEEQSVLSALDNNYSVIIDATNFKNEKWGPFLHRNNMGSVHIQRKDFTDVPLELCIARDAARKEHEKVGERIILGMYEKYIEKKDK